MIHVVPPQIAPDFIRNSPLADAAGWVEVDPATMRHKRHDNVFALGDVANTTNAKTGAAQSIVGDKTTAKRFDIGGVHA